MQSIGFRDDIAVSSYICTRLTNESFAKISITSKINRDKSVTYGITLDNLKMKEGECKVLSLELNSGDFKVGFIVDAVDTKAGKLEVDIWLDANIENFYDEIKNVIFKAIETRYFGQSLKKNTNQFS